MLIEVVDIVEVLIHGLLLQLLNLAISSQIHSLLINHLGLFDPCLNGYMVYDLVYEQNYVAEVNLHLSAILDVIEVALDELQGFPDGFEQKYLGGLC